MDLPSKIELKYWYISEVVGVDATGVIILVNQEETKHYRLLVINLIVRKFNFLTVRGMKPNDVYQVCLQKY